jgi:hypothetical protein
LRASSIAWGGILVMMRALAATASAETTAKSKVLGNAAYLLGEAL